MRLLSIILFIITAMIIAGAAGVLFIFFHYSSDLPDYKKLAEYNPPTTTRLYAADGRLLDEYANEKRLYVPITVIPNRLKHAFIAAEDQNFYYHPGVDISSILRALVININNIGKNRSLVGGSTITQQVVKNFLLTNERSLERKIKEAILAFRITQAYSKDRILELYLNEIYLGNSSYGVAAAALYYFDKSIDELTIEEAAILAAMPKAPSDLDPTRNPERAKERRDWVIERMQDEGYITDAEAILAKAQPIKLRTRDERTVVQAGYFSETVRQELVEMFNEETVYEGGLTVHASIDPTLQSYAQTALRDGLMEYDRRHGYRGPIATIDDMDDWQAKLHQIAMPAGALSWQKAVILRTDSVKATIGLTGNGKESLNGTIALDDMKWARKFINREAIGPKITKPSDVVKQGDVVLVKLKDATNGSYALVQVPEANGALLAMDPHTGKVLAMSGGFEFSTQSQFNRATQAKRQPGSAFKPFVYLAALDKGFTPASIIVDEEIVLDQGEGQKQWRPQNYSGQYYGPTTLRIGIEKSRNAMTVRLAQLIGIKPVMDVSQRLGILENPPRNFSLVLGAAETTLLKLASGYASIVNGGKKLSPTFIDRVQDRDGKTLFKQDKRACIGCQSNQHSHFFKTEQETSAESSDDQPILSDIPPMLIDQREQILDPITAYQMTSILEGVIDRGTGRSASQLNYSLAGKTGTTDDSFDAWFMGFSPNLVVGVYVGFDNPASLGKHETGASAALPIWIDFMRDALKNEPNVPFRRPDGVSLVKIDSESGLLPGPDTLRENIIFEAFRAGTEPKDTAVQTPASIPGGTSSEESPFLGTGGIY